MTTDQSNEELAHQVLCWAEELKWAESVCLLREIFLRDPKRWYALHPCLFHQSNGLSEAMTTILAASCSGDVSMYYAYVPGIRSMTCPDEKTVAESEKEEDSLSSPAKNDQKFWDKFCSENPEELECRIYEV